MPRSAGLARLCWQGFAGKPPRLPHSARRREIWTKPATAGTKSAFAAL
jgi:hypothetical protein